jgi:hypothetical protein
MKTIEEDFKIWIRLDEGFDEIEIKDFLEHVHVVVD